MRNNQKEATMDILLVIVKPHSTYTSGCHQWAAQKEKVYEIIIETQFLYRKTFNLILMIAKKPTILFV